VHASYVVAEIIATDSEFVKQWMLAVTEEVRPGRKKVVEDIRLSARTCARCTEELGENLF
jgi:hypothetical protein